MAFAIALGRLRNHEPLVFEFSPGPCAAFSFEFIAMGLRERKVIDKPRILGGK